jgi:hypothetical protein
MQCDITGDLSYRHVEQTACPRGIKVNLLTQTIIQSGIADCIFGLKDNLLHMVYKNNIMQVLVEKYIEDLSVADSKE